MWWNSLPGKLLLIAMNREWRIHGETTINLPIKHRKEDASAEFLWEPGCTCRGRGRRCT